MYDTELDEKQLSDFSLRENKIGLIVAITQSFYSLKNAIKYIFKKILIRT